jgi:hypothetical protein
MSSAQNAAVHVKDIIKENAMLVANLDALAVAQGVVDVNK